MAPKSKHQVGNEVSKPGTKQAMKQASSLNALCATQCTTCAAPCRRERRQMFIASTQIGIAFPAQVQVQGPERAGLLLSNKAALQVDGEQVTAVGHGPGGGLYARRRGQRGHRRHGRVPPPVSAQGRNPPGVYFFICSFLKLAQRQKMSQAATELLYSCGFICAHSTFTLQGVECW